MRRRLYIFEADGALRRCTIPGQPCPNGPGEWEVLPGVVDRLRTIIDAQEAALAIVTNQGGVGLGDFIRHKGKETKLPDVMTATWLVQQLSFAVAPRTSVAMHFCFHAPKAQCDCRMPKPLMLWNACKQAAVPVQDALMVAESEEGREAARVAGVPFRWAHTFFGWPVPSPASGEGRTSPRGRGEVSPPGALSDLTPQPPLISAETAPRKREGESDDGAEWVPPFPAG